MANHEPYKIKSVRKLHFFSMPERKKFLREASFNVGLLPSSRVTFDMVTQGTSAMSQEQMGSLFIGDEAYAGARNFYKLVRAVNDIFGLEYVCPIHNLYGGIKLLSSIYVKPGIIVAGNTSFPRQTVECFKGKYCRLPFHGENNEPGEIDFKETSQFLEKNKGKIPFLYIDFEDENGAFLSYENLIKLKETADLFQIKLIINSSNITEWAFYQKKQNNLFLDIPLKEIVKKTAGLAHTVVFDAGQDAMSNVGGFLATNNPKEHEKHQNEVVVFEGLHTYGGMAGRTMEVVAVGLREMVNDFLTEWIHAQVSLLEKILQKGKIPFQRGLNGIFLLADEILPHIKSEQAPTLSASLYLTSGIRALLEGPYRQNSKLPILIPRRALMNSQIEQIAEAIIRLCQQREKIYPIILLDDPGYHYEARFNWKAPHLQEYSFSCEPYSIHAVEHVGIRNRAERAQAVKEAGYNTFLLKSEDVTIDFLTDSGTGAMSVEQWTRYLEAQETPATPEAYLEIIKASQETYGYKYIILTHQGRAAEHIMSQMFIKPGDYVPGNMYFTTTKLHQELAGGIFVDVIVDKAHQTTSEFPWKGNIDLKKLDELYRKASKEGKKIAYVSFEFDVNMAGGQPVSMDNIKEVYKYCQSRQIPVFFDATRCAENAGFIQKRDSRYHKVPIADIIREMFSYGDGATISSKKDMLSNLSGSLIFKDNEEWYRKGLQMLQLFEGSFFSGGTSAGDMAAHAQGLREMVDDNYIQSRLAQAEYLGQLLQEAEVPIVLPPGGHAIFLDARRFLPHLDQDQYPAQVLAAQIFIEAGVRAMERGNVSKGRDPETGQNYRPALELVRLTIPRRVYTRDHMRAVAEGIIRLYQKRDTIKGLRFTYEPEKLRFFQSRFEEIPD